MSQETTNHRDELLKEITEAQSQAANVESVGQQLVNQARYAADVARHSFTLISQVPSDNAATPESWETQRAAWHLFNRSAQAVLRHNTSIPTFVAACSGATNTVVQSLSWTVGPSSPGLAVAQDRLRQVVFRDALFDEVIGQMERLDIGRNNGGRRTARELLQDARGALQIPYGELPGPTGVLIPLRESVQSVIAELLRRRPVQEPAGTWQAKVISIGTHCGFNGLDKAHFERLGDSVSVHLNELSGQKQGNLPRDRLVEYFNRGLQTLKALLDGIDEHRLRPAQ